MAISFRPFVRGFALLGAFFVGLGAQVQCPGTTEARPSLESLQAQIDALAPGPLRVFDALGEEVGLLVDPASSNGLFRVYLESIEASILLDPVGGTLFVESPGGQVIFEDPDCEGQGFVAREYVARLSGDIDRFFIGRRVPSVDLGLDYGSRSGGGCSNDQEGGPINDVVP